MYCFWVEKTVVHVPIDGVLKEIVILPSTGELMVVTLEPRLNGDGDCAGIVVGPKSRRNNTEGNPRRKC